MTTASTSSQPAGRTVLGSFNGRLAFSCLLIAISQVNFGMDNGAFNNTQAMPYFKRQFGWYDEAEDEWYLSTDYLALLNSINYLGFAVGLVFGNMTSRRWGRRVAMWLMCGWAAISATILVTARHREQMIAGRCIAFIYIGMELALVPVLQSELVPLNVRALVVATYQSGLLLGNLIMSSICRATSEIDGHASWMIPFGLFYVIPAILAVGIFWLPESPRWLLTRGRPTEAQHSLTLLRQGKYSEQEIEEEFLAIKHSIEVVTEKGTFMDMFRGTNLKRTMITIGVNVFMQVTGQTFATNYSAIFIQSIGGINPFTMACVNQTAGLIAVFICQAFADKAGRKPMLLIGGFIQMSALLVMGGLGTPSTQTTVMGNAIVSMVTVWQFGFNLGWAPISHVVAAEIPTNHLRDLTYALGSLFNILMQFTTAYSLPYLLRDTHAGLGSKVGFIYGATAFMAILFTIFCIPDCKGKTLEEVDELFLTGVPVRHFGKTTPPRFHEENADVKEAEVDGKDDVAANARAV